MSIGKWLKRKAAIISLAMAGVEKNALGQKGDTLEKTINQERRHTQGMLLDSLKQGEITQEVINLRWRTYKILKASEGLSAEVEYVKDENGQEVPVTKMRKVDSKKMLSKVKLDSYDTYPLEMVIDNTEIASGGNDAMDNEFITIYENIKKEVNSLGETISASHGEISANDYFATNKSDKPIIVGRMFIPKFEIEKYTKKLNVRKINKTERLLEFYVSLYPDIDDKKTTLLISDIKKAIKNPLAATFLEIKEVGFITHKALGVEDFLEFQYDVISLDKIIEFNGHYVIKYKAIVKTDGKYILEGHRVTELDEKYNKKEKK